MYKETEYPPWMSVSIDKISVPKKILTNIGTIWRHGERNHDFQTPMQVINSNNFQTRTVPSEESFGNDNDKLDTGTNAIMRTISNL